MQNDMENNTMPNELIISENEFNALIKSQPDVRYQYALKRIVDTETMWSFVDNNGAFFIQSYGNERLFPIWTSKEYAHAFCVKDWSNWKIEAISLDTFENSIIDFICKEELSINVFPTGQEVLGKVVGLNQFAEDLSHALEDYK